MFYTIREKAAYSKAGKAMAKALQHLMFRNSRVHWIQQAMADLDFSKLSK
jgi:hypothetical protein